MLKKTLKIVGIIAIVLVAAFFALKTFTKSKSPAQQAGYNQNGLKITVDYCSPLKKGREVFGPENPDTKVVVPYGKVWRTGANEATIIDIAQDVSIGNQNLKAGKYSLWTIPNADKWGVVINSEVGQWGTNHDASKDVLTVEAPVETLATAQESLSIGFEPDSVGTKMCIRWDKTQVCVPIKK